MRINKTLKTILIYIVPLLIGIGFAIVIFSLEFSGRKEYVKTFIDVGPDTLTDHFPRNKVMFEATYSSVAPQDKMEIGGGYVEVTFEQGAEVIDHIENFKHVGIQEKITKENVFNIDLNYKERKYEILNYSKNSKYPFPDFLNNQTFNDYKILFYDFGTGKFLAENRLKENTHFDSAWRHGYSRGIVENTEGDYKMWLIIW